jgi:hypothetical protein
LASRLFIGLARLALAVTVVVTIAMTLLWAPGTFEDKSSDRIALVGVALVGGTFVLAMLAAIVAVAAYQVSVRVPVLEVIVHLPYASPDKPFVSPVEFAASDVNFRGQLRNDVNVQGTIEIHNKSNVTARNVSLTLRFDGLRGWQRWAAQEEQWVATDDSPGLGASNIQWDAGAAYAIHAGQSRHLRFNLGDMRLWRDATPAFEIELFADGFHAKKKVPIEVISESEFDKRRSEVQDEVLRKRREKT